MHYQTDDPTEPGYCPAISDVPARYVARIVREINRRFDVDSSEAAALVSCRTGIIRAACFAMTSPRRLARRIGTDYGLTSRSEADELAGYSTMRRT